MAPQTHSLPQYQVCRLLAPSPGWLPLRAQPRQTNAQGSMCSLCSPGPAGHPLGFLLRVPKVQAPSPPPSLPIPPHSPEAGSTTSPSTTASLVSPSIHPGRVSQTNSTHSPDHSLHDSTRAPKETSAPPPACQACCKAAQPTLLGPDTQALLILTTRQATHPDSSRPASEPRSQTHPGPQVRASELRPARTVPAHPQQEQATDWPGRECFPQTVSKLQAERPNAQGGSPCGDT